MVSFNPFYQRVMALAKQGAHKAKRIKHPKPVGKGKHKIPGFGKKAKVDSIDVFKVIMHADAGEESARRQQQFFKKHLKKLSKSKLKRLREKMRRVAKRYLGDPEHGEWVSDAEDFLHAAIESQLEDSMQREWELISRIQKKLKTMKCILKGDQIKLQGKEISLKVFCREFFASEAAAYESLVEAGDLIPHREGLTGGGFVRQVVRDFCS